MCSRCFIMVCQWTLIVGPHDSWWSWQILVAVLSLHAWGSWCLSFVIGFQKTPLICFHVSLGFSRKGVRWAGHLCVELVLAPMNKKEIWAHFSIVVFAESCIGPDNAATWNLICYLGSGLRITPVSWMRLGWETLLICLRRSSTTFPS